MADHPADPGARDPWRARLSEYLDGEIAGAEAAELERHLADCTACRALVAELGAVVSGARRLADRPPERDLWPELRAALAGTPATRVWPRLALAFAAGVLVSLGLWSISTRVGAPGHELAAGDAYLLLLHQPEGFDDGGTPAEHAAIVERYARWARELGPRCEAGDELASGGWELRPGDGGVAVGERTALAGLGGYFVVRARDADEALALARGCPHLERGGWIELRRVQAH